MHTRNYYKKRSEPERLMILMILIPDLTWISGKREGVLDAPFLQQPPLD